MAWTIDDFEAQMRNDLRRWTSNGIEELPTPHLVVDGNDIVSKRWRIYTDINAYTFSASMGHPGSMRTYLGCISTCRKPRAGEDWSRGSDLADGPLSLETWHRILADIVSYEMVKIHKAPAQPEIRGVADESPPTTDTVRAQE